MKKYIGGYKGGKSLLSVDIKIDSSLCNWCHKNQATQYWHTGVHICDRCYNEVEEKSKLIQSDLKQIRKEIESRGLEKTKEKIENKVKSWF